MRVKYIIDRSEENKLSIREYTVLDKKDQQMFTLLCEETYDDEAVKDAIAAGKTDLIDTLRTVNLYPQSVYIDSIADMVVELYESDAAEPREAIFDDSDLLTEQARERELLEDLDAIIEEESDEFDELIEDEDEIKHIKTTIQVADEEVVDIEKNKIDDDMLV